MGILSSTLGLFVLVAHVDQFFLMVLYFGDRMAYQFQSMILGCVFVRTLKLSHLTRRI